MSGTPHIGCGVADPHYHEQMPVEIDGVVHLHRMQFGPPYDAKPVVTCEPCLVLMKASLDKFKLKICKRMGWEQWPFDD